MPQGGGHDADAYSPFKSADGRELRRLMSSKSSTGYHCVVKIHNKFYPKKKLDGEKGSKAMKTFGTGQPEAWMAANILAEYLDSPYELPVAPPRAPYGSRNTEKYLEDKKRRRLDLITAEAQQLLGIDPNEPEPEWTADPADPAGAPMVCVDAIDGAAPGAPTAHILYAL